MIPTFYSSTHINCHTHYGNRRQLQPPRPIRPKKLVRSRVQILLRQPLSSPSTPSLESSSTLKHQRFRQSWHQPRRRWTKRRTSSSFKHWHLATKSGLPRYFMFLDLIEIRPMSKGKAKVKPGAVGTYAKLKLMPSLCAEYGREIHPLVNEPYIIQAFTLASKTVVPDTLSIRFETCKIISRPDYHRYHPEKYRHNPHVTDLDIYVPSHGASFHLFCRPSLDPKGSVDVIHTGPSSKIIIPIPPNYPKSPS